MRIRRLLPELLLASVATLLTLAAVEVALRVKLWADNKKTFERVFETNPEGVPIPASGTTKLAHLIRPSRNPVTVYELKPNLDVVFVNRRVTTNEHGFRGPAHAVGPSDAFRIVGLGDSFMFGWGVEDGREYLRLLEQELNQAFPRTRWEIINTAVPGYNAAMEIATLKDKGLLYQPRLVIIGFASNDFGLPAFIRLQDPVLTLRKSYLAEFLQKRLRQAPPADEPPRPPSGLAASGLTIPPTRARTGTGIEDDPNRVPPQYRGMVGWNGYRRAMEELQQLKREHRFAVVSLFLSETHGVHKQRAMSLAAELGFHVVDIRPALRAYMRSHGITSYRGSLLTVSEKDNHPSAVGHRITADVLLEYLIENDLLALGTSLPTTAERAGFPSVEEPDARVAATGSASPLHR